MSENRTQSESNSTKTKACRVFKSLNEREIIDHLCLLIEFIQRKHELSPVFKIRDILITWSKKLQKLDSYTPTNWEIEKLFALMFTLQINGSQVLNKASLNYKTGKRC